jgi:hypothetical protein
LPWFKAVKAFCLIFSLWLASQCPHAGAETNPIDPAQFEYNLKTSLQSYDSIGRRNPKWDAEARQVLKTFALVRAWTNGTTVELVSELRTNLSRLEELQCDDPLIRYVCWRFGSGKHRSAKEYTTAIEQIASALQESGYPEIRKFYATYWYRKSLQESEANNPEKAFLLEKADFFLAKALDDKSMGQREADQACEALMAGAWCSDPTRWTIYRALEPALTNRWNDASFALLAKGRAYLCHAWMARGAGFANTVTDTGWKSFAERLDVADEALETAWKLNPTDPRICLEMIRVELGQGHGRARMEMWFQRGMSLAPASYDLCYEKMWYLRPRWYGSTQDMIDFGRQCTTNSNWKGDVRLMLADAHYDVASDIQDKVQRTAYWLQPDVWKDIHFTFEEFFKLYPDAVGYRHNYARYAAWCGKWDEFERQIKQFPSTNYAYFGGLDRFNLLVQTAEDNLKKH